MTLQIPSVVGAIAIALGGTAGSESPDCRGYDCDIREKIYVGLNRTETIQLSSMYPPGATPSDPISWYEYSPVISCSGNDPYYPDRVHCEYAATYCEERQPGSSGPYSQVYRRVVDESGPQGEYAFVAATCYRSDVPPRSGEGGRELTEEMILEQFHQTDFALPTMSIEPPDGRTLVNLPVFYELVWPEDGFEPDEIDTTEIIGFEVRIRPFLESATYHFGDGTSVGPTTSLGGQHPDGDITHEYVDAAAVEPHITVVYGGEVSVDGGAWSVIPGTATIEGPLNPLEVLTSRNRLYD